MTINTFLVNWENWRECKKVCGDILWMFYDLAKGGAIVHNIDFEDIDYQRYLCAEPGETGDSSLLDMVSLLRSGSLIALCCHLYNLLSDEQRDQRLVEFLEAVPQHPGAKDSLEIRRLVESALTALAEPRDAGWELLPGGSALRTEMKSLYEKHVVNFFVSLSAQSKRAD